MQFCQKHWDMLRTAIEARGLTHLIAKSGEAAMERAVDELQGRADDSSYDPLMAAHWMIANRAVEMGGLYFLSGGHCPVCEAIKHTAHWPREGENEPAGEAWVESHWIDGPADAVLTHCQERGLTAPPQ
jgi:hypothetical protein